ncbi:hypothetical protein, partial [Acutalibacter sp. 1XD8-36]|uniref:hypothetical protein n=1 Tax=Acutalibacter sp. 1XD8-36 TaxID=2320852 RepID=UPI001A9C1B19
MTKRITSLLMALILVFSVISISVYAAEDEGIEPRGPVIRCDNCGAAVPTSRTITWAGNGYVLATCDNSDKPHN